MPTFATNTVHGLSADVYVYTRSATGVAPEVLK